MKTIKICFTVTRAFDCKEIAHGSINEKVANPDEIINGTTPLQRAVESWKKLLDQKYDRALYTVSVSGMFLR